MAYDCINGWEDIIGAMVDSKLLTIAPDDSDDAAVIATHATTAIYRAVGERKELRAALADLQEWAARCGGWESEEWDRARAILAKVPA